jgi:hypothetical protein
LATNQGENGSTHIPGEQIREEILKEVMLKKIMDSLVLSLLFGGPFFKPNLLYANKDSVQLPMSRIDSSNGEHHPSPEDLSPPGCALGMLCALMAQSACFDRVAQLTTLGE